MQKKSKIKIWLEHAPKSTFTMYAAAMVFMTYFCAYAFRKPYQAVTYENLSLWGLDLKTVLVISQLLGYTLSKWVGVKICSEIKPHQRMKSLYGLVIWAQLMLVAFGLLPESMKCAAIFLNGLSLGMIWGVIVLYLEGRCLTEILFAGLSSSLIFSSGIVKDAGIWLMSSFQVNQFWMPAATGLLFLPLFLLVVWLLNQLPEPTLEDQSERTIRHPMQHAERLRFFNTFKLGIILQLIVYVLLMSFRDFRDSYGIDIIENLGIQNKQGIFTRMEVWVAITALLALVVLNFFKPKRYGVSINIIMMMMGFSLIGVSTYLLDIGMINGFTWMVLVGMGGYLGYIPCDTIFYDRVIAATGFTGTAVFMAYLMDASGYTGSILLQFSKEWFASGQTRLNFFRIFCYIITFLGLIILSFNYFYFKKQTQKMQNR